MCIVPKTKQVNSAQKRAERILYAGGILQE